MFELHPTLAADTAEIARWSLCRVLLMDEINYPWLILVPERAGVTELHQLSRQDRILLIEEVAHASERLAAHAGAGKINVAALGNVVPQLHVHVIARFQGDPAWPRPVWGAVPVRRYEPAALRQRLEDLRRALEKSPTTTL